MTYSDGKPDPSMLECPSCLSFHMPSYLNCNGHREPCDEQCPAILGETRCHRPANHIGAHQAKSAAMRVEWEITP